MLPAKPSRTTGLKKLLQMESLICDGIQSDARSHMRAAFKDSRTQNILKAALRRNPRQAGQDDN